MTRPFTRLVLGTAVVNLAFTAAVVLTWVWLSLASLRRYRSVA